MNERYTLEPEYNPSKEEIEIPLDKISDNALLLEVQRLGSEYYNKLDKMCYVEFYKTSMEQWWDRPMTIGAKKLGCDTLRKLRFFEWAHKKSTGAIK